MPAEEHDDESHVTLIDESGRERRFLLHDAFELEGGTYYLVEAEDGDEVLLLREEGGALQTVDEPEFQRVMTALEKDEVE